MDSIVYIFPILITALVLFFVLRPILRMRRMSAQLAKTGVAELATVVDIGQTGLTINQVPQMRITVDLHAAGEAARRITFKQMLQLGNIPAAGDNVYVVIDPAHPENAMIAGVAPRETNSSYAFAAPSATAVTADGAQAQPLTEQQRMDIMTIAPRLREHGKLAIATILAIRPQVAPSVSFDLEIDAINAPKRKVTVTQAMFGEAYKQGERIYLLVDPDNPDSIALMPLSALGNQHLPQGANRLDAMVLGPQILHEGAKATGTVLAATQVPINTPQLAAAGFTRWHLRVHIVPADGTAPYDAEQDISFSTPEKAQRMSTVGNTIPIRYDSNDPQSFVTDSMALGYPDPYESVLAAMKQKLKTS